ncbi:hypothetical protein [Cupriavidus necator]|uniref:hypothetical protein n=1 Tax=Cupriavidus necator TaxID=106590 RepID=UPI0039C07EDE
MRKTMNFEARGRFSIWFASACVSAIALGLTLVWPQWIELLVGAQPDVAWRDREFHPNGQAQGRPGYTAFLNHEMPDETSIIIGLLPLGGQGRPATPC